MSDNLNLNAEELEAFRELLNERVEAKRAVLAAAAEKEAEAKRLQEACDAKQKRIEADRAQREMAEQARVEKEMLAKLAALGSRKSFY